MTALNANHNGSLVADNTVLARYTSTSASLDVDSASAGSTESILKVIYNSFQDFDMLTIVVTMMVECLR